MAEHRKQDALMRKAASNVSKNKFLFEKALIDTTEYKHQQLATKN